MKSKKCNHCPKVIEGHTEKEVEHNMAVHKIAKHKDEEHGKQTTTE